MSKKMDVIPDADTKVVPSLPHVCAPEYTRLCTQVHKKRELSMSEGLRVERESRKIVKSRSGWTCDFVI